MPRYTLDVKCFGSVQKSPSSKAAAIFARGAYTSYVSTEQWRERRWRLFSTDPVLIPFGLPRRWEHDLGESITCGPMSKEADDL